ncbi:MAG: hypothetical protein K1X72_11840 [Pyrinomonadaceae bacterium]|nr:hypothetical protein [Pyrinomonadaceae bacterium]
MENKKLETNENTNQVNSYQEEFLKIQNDLIDEETAILQLENEEKKRKFERLSEDWHETFLGENY